MTDVRVPPAEGRAAPARFGDEVAADWLRAIGDAPDGIVRPPELLATYGALARVAVDGALEPAGDEAAVERAVAEAAAAIRRAHLTIAQALADVGLLAPVVLARVAERANVSDEGLETLQAAVPVFEAVSRMTTRLADVLEASAMRRQREHSETLAAMTDQLSHELRNRLGAAQTAADMLRNPDIELDDQGLAHVARLVQISVEAALRTVGDVRDLIASRTAAEEPTPRPTPLPTLVRSVLEELAPPALEAEVALEVVGDPAECEVDAARLRLIVFNLVGNGVKYSDPEKDERWVRVRTRRLEDDRVEIEVEDNGVGIAEEDLDAVFFYRARGADTGAVPGSGLGLAIAREAIDQIGGEIVVSSKVGEGSAFTARFQPLRWLG